jgi:hypothetical protein
MKQKEKDQIQMMFFWQSIAATRQVDTEARLMAMANDILAIRDGSKPVNSQRLTMNKEGEK